MRTPGIHRGPLKGVSDVQLLLTEPTQAEAKCRSAEQIQLKLGDMSCPKLSDELMAALRTLNHRLSASGALFTASQATPSSAGFHRSDRR